MRSGEPPLDGVSLLPLFGKKPPPQLKKHVWQQHPRCPVVANVSSELWSRNLCINTPASQVHEDLCAVIPFSLLLSFMSFLMLMPRSSAGWATLCATSTTATPPGSCGTLVLLFTHFPAVDSFSKSLYRFVWTGTSLAPVMPKMPKMPKEAGAGARGLGGAGVPVNGSQGT